MSYAEPTHEIRAEDASILCLMRRRKTKSIVSKIDEVNSEERGLFYQLISHDKTRLTNYYIIFTRWPLAASHDALRIETVSFLTQRRKETLRKI